MIISFECPLTKTKRVVKKWKTGNKEGWKEYNLRMTRLSQETIKNYTKFERELNTILEETIGSVKIGIGKKKKNKTNENTKHLKAEVKRLRKEFAKAIKENWPTKGEVMKKYIEYQKELRTENQKTQQEETKNLIQKIIDEGGTKSTTFWKVKRRICGKQGSANYTTINEDGEPIEDPTKAKEHIANYYENLYQAREGRPEYAQWTNDIKATIKRIEQSETMKQPAKSITTGELKKAVKKLKSGKATGPDNIPNEVLKEASDETLEVIKQVFNNITQEK